MLERELFSDRAQAGASRRVAHDRRAAARQVAAAQPHGAQPAGARSLHGRPGLGAATLAQGGAAGPPAWHAAVAPA